MPFAGYTDFDECVAKNSDKGDPKAYCGSIKAKVEEANRIYAKEQGAQEPEGLTTPDAGDQDEGVVKDLTSPQGSGREAENDQASGDGELSPADPAQDQAEDPANPQDQAKPNGTTTEVSPDSEIIKEDEYGKLNGDKHDENERDQKDEKRDEHQGLEYNGESYHKVKAIEFDDEIYVQKDDKDEASEDDLEYEDDEYRKASEDDLELDDDIYVKDNEQAPMGGDLATPELDVPELNPIGESVIIKENGKFKKYNVFQAREQEEGINNLNPPEAKVKDVPKVEQPQGDVNLNPQEPEVKPAEPSEDITSVEKIIIKENGKLKFKSVYTEVKKKL